MLGQVEVKFCRTLALQEHDGTPLAHTFTVWNVQTWTSEEITVKSPSILDCYISTWNVAQPKKKKRELIDRPIYRLSFCMDPRVLSFLLLGNQIRQKSNTIYQKCKAGNINHEHFV